jgi:protein PhnA
MADIPACPLCSSENTYPLDGLINCPDCGHEWDPSAVAAVEEAAADGPRVVKDANGTVLQHGDTVVVIKNLPVKGSPQPIKAGTKVKNIRLVEGDHNIDCKIDGFGSMGLKSEFVKKA